MISVLVNGPTRSVVRTDMATSIPQQPVRFLGIYLFRDAQDLDWVLDVLGSSESEEGLSRARSEAVSASLFRRRRGLGFSFWAVDDLFVLDAFGGG